MWHSNPKIFFIFHRNVKEFTHKQIQQQQQKNDENQPKKKNDFSKLQTILATLRQRIINDSISGLVFCVYDKFVIYTKAHTIKKKGHHEYRVCPSLQMHWC